MTHQIHIESLLIKEKGDKLTTLKPYGFCFQASKGLIKLAEKPKPRLSTGSTTQFKNQSDLSKNQPDGMTVAEIQSRDDLPEELPGLFGSQPALLHQVVKQLSP